MPHKSLILQANSTLSGSAAAALMGSGLQQSNTFPSLFDGRAPKRRESPRQIKPRASQVKPSAFRR
jgi:hypothetical protein